MSEQRRGAKSRFETRLYVHPDDKVPENFWLNDDGNRALRFLHLHGACRELGPEAFFPERGQAAHEAYAVCADCEVRAACLAFALSTTERDGVWGGLNEVARRPLMRRVAAGESPDDVAADYCDANPVRHHTFGGRRSRYPEALRAEAVRICAEAGPGIASERTGVPATTVKAWAARARTKAKGETRTMTDDEVSQLVEQAVSVAVAAQTEALNRALSETLAELVERLDVFTSAVSSGFHVLAPLDPALGEVAAMVDGAASVPAEPAQSHEDGLDDSGMTDG